MQTSRIMKNILYLFTNDSYEKYSVVSTIVCSAIKNCLIAFNMYSCVFPKELWNPLSVFKWNSIKWHWSQRLLYFHTFCRNRWSNWGLRSYKFLAEGKAAEGVHIFNDTWESAHHHLYILNCRKSLRIFVP